MKIAHFQNTCCLVTEFRCQNEGGYISAMEPIADAEEQKEHIT